MSCGPVLTTVYFLSCTSTCGKTTYVCSFLGEQSFECVELQRPACSLCRDTAVTTDGFFDVTHPGRDTRVETRTRVRRVHHMIQK